MTLSNHLRLAVFAVFAGSVAVAADHTVCASGCNFTDPCTAHNDAGTVGGDTITVRAGESFAMACTLSWKAGAKYITFRSSRWPELPATGYRVNESHSPLMAQFTPSDANTAIMRAGREQTTVSSINAGANTITVASSVGIVEGDPIACRIANSDGMGGPTTSVIMGGVTANRQYIMTGVTGATFQLTYQGAVVDIIDIGTGTQYCTPGKVGHNVQFKGIDFYTGAVALVTDMLQLGTGLEASVEGMPHHFEIEHSLFRGQQNLNGPKRGIAINANNVSVRDSWFGHIKMTTDETHCIYGGVNSWGIRIENNYLNCATHGILTGGTGSAIPNRQVSELLVLRNHIFKSGYMQVVTNSSRGVGTGSPTALSQGACFPGQMYRDTTISISNCTAGGCYPCNGSGYSGTWGSQDTSMTFRSQYQLKAPIELKQCSNCRIEGNWIENGFEGADSGNPGTASLASQADAGICGNSNNPWTNIQNTGFTNNRGDNLWRAWHTGTCGGAAQQNRNLLFVNNTVTNLCNHPEMTYYAAGNNAHCFSFGIDSGMQGAQFLYNTVRKGASASVHSWLRMNETVADGPLTNFKMEGNIGPEGTYNIIGFTTPDTDGTCGAAGLAQIMTIGVAPFSINANLLEGTDTPGYAACRTNTVNVNPVPFVSSTDNRLQLGSPYSPDCVSGCAFTAPNGKAPGAFIDEQEYHTSGTVAGTPRWLEDLSIQPASTRATLTYTAPSTAACDVKLWTNFARTTLHADTSDAGEQTDARSGSYSAGTRRIFVLGTNTLLTASTKVWGQVACGTQIRPFEFSTQAAGSDRSVPISYSTARTGERSASPTFSSPTAYSSSTTHVVPLVAGAAPTWYRETGGVTQAYLTP
jgi:hypothetical protein